MINGEPTENKLAWPVRARCTWNWWRVARWRTRHTRTGRVCHRQTGGSAAPAARDEAPEMPMSVLARRMSAPSGRTRANVIPDYAKADLFYRLVGPADALRRDIAEAVGNLVEVHFTRETPFLRLRTIDACPPWSPPSPPTSPRCRIGRTAAAGPRLDHVAHTRRVRGKGATSGGGEDYCSMAKRLSS